MNSSLAVVLFLAIIYSVNAQWRSYYGSPYYGGGGGSWSSYFPSLSSMWNSIQSSGWGTAAKGLLAGAVLGGLFGR
ncbi:hypothetical protein Aduo_013776 [Ancylostoma duodenale]